MFAPVALSLSEAVEIFFRINLNISDNQKSTDCIKLMSHSWRPGHSQMEIWACYSVPYRGPSTLKYRLMANMELEMESLKLNFHLDWVEKFSQVCGNFVTEFV